MSVEAQAVRLDLVLAELETMVAPANIFHCSADLRCQKVAEMVMALA